MVQFRFAIEKDLSDIVSLLRNDELGITRESQDLVEYQHAFKKIKSQTDNMVIVGEINNHVVACLQLTIIPTLARSASSRAQIEGVRVHTSVRGKGIGKQLIQYAIAIAYKNDCGIVQLTTDKSRQKTKEFYEKLGFLNTHYGMKLIL